MVDHPSKEQRRDPGNRNPPNKKRFLENKRRLEALIFCVGAVGYHHHDPASVFSQNRMDPGEQKKVFRKQKEIRSSNLLCWSLGSLLNGWWTILQRSKGGTLEIRGDGRFLEQKKL